MKRIITILIVLATSLPTTFAMISLQPDDEKINLAGRWQITWGEGRQGYVSLPGSMLTNHIGEPPSVDTKWTASIYDSSFYFNPYMAKFRTTDNFKLPFSLTPEKTYVGKAVYERQVFIPSIFPEGRVFLYLERPHIETTVFVNGNMAGHQTSLSVAHEYDITDLINLDAKNTVTIEVYNGIENVGVGQDSHSVTDQTQGNWNGIAGEICFYTTPDDYIRNIAVFPDVESKTITIRALVHLSGKIPGEKVFTYEMATYTYPEDDLKTEAEMIILGTLDGRKIKTATDTLLIFSVPFPENYKLWDEFHPDLYKIEMQIGDRKHTIHSLSTITGLRSITTEGMKMMINGRELLLRGTVENCCFPLTGYPPTNIDSWLAIYRKCKSYGLNHVRFHSYCPPEAAFTAADIAGMYLQAEGPSWPNHGVKLGVGMAIDDYLMAETQRIDSIYGNHPSFCLLAAGNEPSGNWVNWGRKFVDYWKKHDPRHLYTTASVGGGWQWTPDDQFRVKGGGLLRGLNWDNRRPQSVDDFSEAIRNVPQKILPRGSAPVINNSPMVSHETGQWCAFPDLKEQCQYTGAYKAGNFDIFADLLKRNNMSHLADSFLMASGRLQTLCYKYDIERNLRTPGYTGFQMLSLNDYSGQGTALVGPLNVFWREKGYCDSTQWRQFCSPVVALARFGQFVFKSTDTLDVDVMMYNAGKPLGSVVIAYELVPEGEEESITWEEEMTDLPEASRVDLDRINTPLDFVQKAAKFTLHIRLYENGENRTIPLAHNSYDFWVYPEIEDEKAGNVYISDTLDSKALKRLRKGGRVLLLAAGKIKYGADVVQHYLPVFWNTSWFKMRPPHTTGALIRRNHPMFRDFPTDDWGNLNWWELLNKAQVMNLAALPASYQSPIQPIDTWHVSRKLGMVIEARVGKGRLLITTCDLADNLDSRPVARQLRHSLLRYMNSEEFNPQMTLDIENVRDLFEKSAPAVVMFTNESPDELKPKIN